jgi:hypothetical protein
MRGALRAQARRFLGARPRVPPQRNATALNKRMIRMTRPSEILNEWKRGSEHFNGVNISTAVSRLARARPSHYVRIRSSEEFSAIVRVVVQRTHEVSADRSDFFGPRQLSNLSHGFAKMGFDDELVFSKIARAVVTSNSAQHMEGQELSALVWSFAKANIRAPELYAAVAKEAAQRGANLSDQALSNLVWAYARAGESSPALFEAVAEQVVERAARMDDQGLVMAAWSFATAKVAHPTLFAALASELAGRFDVAGRDDATLPVSSTHNWHLAMVAWSFATAGVAAPELFRAIASSAPQRTFQEEQQLSNLVWAFAKSDSAAPALFDALAPHIEARLPRMSEQALVNVAWAYATAEIDAPTLFRRLAEECVRPARLAAMKPLELSVAVWSFSRAGVFAPSLFDAVARAAAPPQSRGRPESRPAAGTWRALDMSPRSLAMTAQAFATSAVDSPRLFAVIGAIAARSAGQMSKRDLASTLWSLALRSGSAHEHEIEILWNVLRAKAREGGRRLAFALTTEERQMLRQVRLTVALEAPHIELAPLEGEAVAASDHADGGRALAQRGRPSRHQREVSAALRALGWEHSGEVAVDDAVGRLDMACTTLRVGVEFDGPSHFHRCEETGDVFANGATQWKSRMLDALGWRLVRISYMEWSAASEGGREERDAFLRHAMRSVGVELRGND